MPTAFDIILGSQLGLGAYRALSERGITGHMVVVKRQFQLDYIPFEKLIDEETLYTKVRYIPTDSDFYFLAKQLMFPY